MQSRHNSTSVYIHIHGLGNSLFQRPNVHRRALCARYATRVKVRSLIGLEGQITLKWREHADIKRLQDMRAVPRKYQQINHVLHAVRNNRGGDMAAMAASKMRRRRASGSIGRVDGSNSKQLRNHSNPWVSDVHPLLLVEKYQSSGVSGCMKAMLVCIALQKI